MIISCKYCHKVLARENRQWNRFGYLILLCGVKIKTHTNKPSFLRCPACGREIILGKEVLA